MPSKVIRARDVKVEKILGGPIKPIINSKTAGSKNLVFALGVFDSGEELVPHIHPQSEEVYYVLQGKGTVYLGEERKEIQIEPEMALYIPPGTIHAIMNTSQQRLTVAFFIAPGTEPSEEIGN